MHRNHLLNLLDRFEPFDERSSVTSGAIKDFVRNNPRCFDNLLKDGHVTGSAWIVDPSGTKTLLTHHRKFGKWIQPGGHADSDSNILGVALREAREETGLHALEPVSEEIFDVDIHEIPARGTTERHLHYDIRFALRCVGEIDFTVSEESLALAWVDIKDIESLTHEESVLRMARKWTSGR